MTGSPPSQLFAGTATSTLSNGWTVSQDVPKGVEPAALKRYRLAHSRKARGRSVTRRKRGRSKSRPRRSVRSSRRGHASPTYTHHVVPAALAISAGAVPFVANGSDGYSALDFVEAAVSEKNVHQLANVPGAIASAIKENLALELGLIGGAVLAVKLPAAVKRASRLTRRWSVF